MGSSRYPSSFLMHIHNNYMAATEDYRSTGFLQIIARKIP